MISTLSKLVNFIIGKVLPGDDNKKNARAVTMLESAITIPVVLVTIFGIIDFSRYLSAKSLMSYGASDAAQLASTIADLDKDPTDSTHENPLVTNAINALTDKIRSSPNLGKLLSATQDANSASPSSPPPFTGLVMNDLAKQL